jgi:hypothetical protein
MGGDITLLAAQFKPAAASLRHKPEASCPHWGHTGATLGPHDLAPFHIYDHLAPSTTSVAGMWRGCSAGTRCTLLCPSASGITSAPSQSLGRPHLTDAQLPEKRIGLIRSCSCRQQGRWHVPQAALPAPLLGGQQHDIGSFAPTPQRNGDLHTCTPAHLHTYTPTHPHPTLCQTSLLL